MTLSEWTGPRRIIDNVEKYVTTIDGIELKIVVDNDELIGHIQDNGDPFQHWLSIYYDKELEKMRYMVPGRLLSQPPIKSFFGAVEPGVHIEQSLDNEKDLAIFMENLVGNILKTDWNHAISEASLFSRTSRHLIS